jgi:hypothetical protein
MGLYILNEFVMPAAALNLLIDSWNRAFSGRSFLK